MSQLPLLNRLRQARRERRFDRKRRRFLRSGMRPWTEGYGEYKDSEIVRVLREAVFRDGELPGGYGFRLDERIIEYPWLFSRLSSAPGELLDAGSALNFEFILGQPALARKKLHICTLAPESDCFWQKSISYLYGDLRHLPYRDGWFDWVVSLSTIEHVGMDNTLLYAAAAGKETNPEDYLVAVRELHRVLKPGGSAFLSVPFGKAVNMGWYQVFDQAMIEVLIRAFKPFSCSIDYFHYHPEGWRRSTASETAHATAFDIHKTKIYDADFAAAARAVCCLELKK